METVNATLKDQDFAIVSSGGSLSVYLPRKNANSEMQTSDIFLAGCFMLGSGTTLLDRIVRGVIVAMARNRVRRANDDD